MDLSETHHHSDRPLCSLVKFSWRTRTPAPLLARAFEMWRRPCETSTCAFNADRFRYLTYVSHLSSSVSNNHAATHKPLTSHLRYAQVLTYMLLYNVVNVVILIVLVL